MAQKKKSKYSSLKDRGAVAAGSEQLEHKSSGCINSGGKEFWKPTEGKNNNFDIIPYEITVDNHPYYPAGELFQQLAYKVHYGVGSQERMVACPTVIGKKCPICEAAASMRKDRNADEEELKKLKAKDRVIFNIIDLNEVDKGVQLFEFSPHCFANFLYDEIKASEGKGDDTFELIGGCSLMVRFSNKKLGTNKFLEATRIDFEERDKDYDDAIVEEALDLDTAINYLPYEEIEAILLDLELPPPKREAKQAQQSTKSAPSAKDKTEPRRSRREEPEDEPEPEEDDPGPEEDGTPGEKPAPRSRRSTKEEKKEEAPGNKCPNDFQFGEDYDQDNACDACDIWESCKAHLDELEAARKPSRRK